MDNPEQITGRNLRGRKGARSRRTRKTEDLMEAGTSSGRMVSDEEMGSQLQEMRPKVRKGKGGGRRIVTSNEEEESATYDDEPSWKEKQG